MKALRISLYLLMGLVYMGYSLAYPENKWMARGVLILALIAVYWLTRLIAGKEVANSSPLEADPIPSLNLSARALEPQAPKAGDTTS